MMRWDILNYIAKKIDAKTHLEIGVYDGTCMQKIDVAGKWGVDPTPQLEAVKATHVFHTETSDAFFEGPGTMLFDLIFIDGDHHAKQAYRDIQNSIKRLTPKGVVVVHDCNPEDEALQIVPAIQGLWTGDVWKAIVQLRAEATHQIRVVNCDYGVGVVIPATPGSFEASTSHIFSSKLEWADLEKDRKNILGLLEPLEWTYWFDSETAKKVQDR